MQEVGERKENVPCGSVIACSEMEVKRNFAQPVSSQPLWVLRWKITRKTPQGFEGNLEEISLAEFMRQEKGRIERIQLEEYVAVWLEFDVWKAEWVAKHYFIEMHHFHWNPQCYHLSHFGFLLTCEWVFILPFYLEQWVAHYRL